MRASELLVEATGADVRLVPGSSYSRNELAQLTSLIAQGGEVSPDMVQRNLVNSPLVAASFIDQVPVGVVVLKIPNASYKQKVFQAADVADLEASFRLEVGYAFVEPQYRSQGVGTELLRALRTKMPAGVFATTREIGRAHV